MSWKTPPTVDPSLKQELDSFVSVASSNAAAIGEKLLFAGIRGSGIESPKVSLSPLVKLIDTMLIPAVHFFEGTWSEHPNDSGGATMRGVTASTFVSTFDFIFINTGIPQVKTAAEAFNKKHAGWKSNSELAKKVLYTICSNDKVAGLWFYKFLADKSCRYPIAVMTEDPFLGFFFADVCWLGGAGMYLSDYCNFDAVGKAWGWDGNASSWAKFVATRGSKTPEFASNCLVKKFAHIERISKGDKAVFREGWMNRLINDKQQSNIIMMVKINEFFNLNTKGLFQLTPAELEHLKAKAESYKTFSLEIPG